VFEGEAIFSLNPKPIMIFSSLPLLIKTAEKDYKGGNSGPSGFKSVHSELDGSNSYISFDASSFALSPPIRYILVFPPNNACFDFFPGFIFPFAWIYCQLKVGCV
jgi:hypothetical protein